MCVAHVMPSPVLLWLRQDLRLRDQPALIAAAEQGPVIPVYVLDDETPGEWRMGGAQRWWLHGSLSRLSEALEARGSRLILRRGRAASVLQNLLVETGASRVHAIRHYEPWWREAEAQLGDALCLHEGNHLRRPDSVTTGSGGAYRVFSAFWRALEQSLPPAEPLPMPATIASPDAWPASDTLEDWALLPHAPDWATGFDWQAGEDAADIAARAFTDKVSGYANARNLPAEQGTSRLSPHLHFGEISPATLWHMIGPASDVLKFHKELAWRDFTSGLVAAMPDYGDKAGRPAMNTFPWRTGAAAQADLRAWQRGMTGYPIVDAGMRQLWTTGWMHNRVRMLTASFLVKHLLIDWREGERWFWDTLVDADYGNNAVNWQWVAGTGIDANMFSRIMAPLSQSEKFDAGDYIRRWVPELAGIADPAIHDPDAHGVRPRAYPAKIIGHREARERALAANRRR